MRFFDAFMGAEKLIKRRRTAAFFANLHGNKQTRGIHTFHVDLDSGEILPRNLFSTPVDPIYSFNYGRFVCITYRNPQAIEGQGGINSYSATADLLALVSRASDEGKTYVHGCANGDDTNATFVFCADYHNGDVVSIRIIKKKLVKIKGHFIQEGSSLDEKYQTQSHPTFIHSFNDTNKIVYVDLGLDEVVFLDYDQEGYFTKDETHSFKVKAGNGPCKLIFDAAGKFAYILNQLASTIDVYQVDGYKFTLIQTIDSYKKEDPDQSNLATDFELSTNGDFAYALNSGDDSIVIFKVNDDHTLTYGDFCDTSKNPVDMLVYENSLVVVACGDGSSLESYRLVDEKRIHLMDLNHGYLVHEPVCLTKFESKL